MPSTINLHIFHHRGSDQIAIKFPYSTHFHKLTKQLGSKWSNTHRCWYLNFSEDNVKAIIGQFHGKVELKARGIPEFESIYRLLFPWDAVLTDYRGYLQGYRYSESTIQNYVSLMRLFLQTVDFKPLDEIDETDFQSFLREVLYSKGYSISTQRQFIGAFKLFLRQHDLQNISTEALVRPRKSDILPRILSKHEVLAILSATANLKHRTILSLMYSAGLRVSEVVHLKISDVNSQRSLIRVEQAKNRKDRYVGLSDKLLVMLRNYYKAYRPRHYLFEGMSGGMYSSASIRAFLGRSAQRAGVRKRVTPHMLRHSFATHLLESGVDVRYIQELLGHASPRTTMIYTHVTHSDIRAIKSPFDSLMSDEDWSREFQNKGNRILHYPPIVSGERNKY